MIGGGGGGLVPAGEAIASEGLGLAAEVRDGGGCNGTTGAPRPPPGSGATANHAITHGIAGIHGHGRM